MTMNAVQSNRRPKLSSMVNTARTPRMLSTLGRYVAIGADMPAVFVAPIGVHAALLGGSGCQNDVMRFVKAVVGKLWDAVGGEALTPRSKNDGRLRRRLSDRVDRTRDRLPAALGVLADPHAVGI